MAQNLKKYDILITEVMYDPTPVISLPEEEYLEVYNNSNSEINLSTIEINIGTKQFIPDSFLLAPDSFYVFWDKAIPTLKNSGDSIILFHQEKVIHRIDYSPSLHTSGFKKDGGWSLELIDFSKPCLLENNWSSSNNYLGGTPGASNSLEAELQELSLELESYFPISDSNLLVTFSNNIETLVTDYPFTIKDNLAFINIPHLDSVKIDSLIIHDAQTCFQAIFEPSTIIYGLPVLADSGSIIISEILFNPSQGGYDFIELYNNSIAPINLAKLQFSKFDSDGLLTSAFPITTQNQLILPGQYKVVCPEKAWLKETFPNSKNIIESKIPSMNNDEGNLLLVNTQGQIIDQLNYFESWHYFELNSTENVSLEKIILTSKNNASNWTSSSTSNNYATPGYQNANNHSTLSTNQNIKLPYNIITPNADGYHDQLIIQYSFPSVGWTGKIDILNYSGITIHTLSYNELFGKKGTILWDGMLADGRSIQAGIYAIWINSYNLNQNENYRKKITFYVNKKIR